MAERDLPERLDDWPGMEDPNYTPVPDGFFDVLLPKLTDIEIRVLLYIIRRTYGFKKPSDQVSLSQIVKGIKTRDGRQLDSGAGVSKNGAITAVQRLEARGVLLVQRHDSTERGHEANTYSIRKAGAPLPLPRTSLAHREDKGSAPRMPALAQPVDPQETAAQETENKNGSAVRNVQQEGARNALREQIKRDRPQLTPGTVAVILAAWATDDPPDWLAWWQAHRWE